MLFLVVLVARVRSGRSGQLFDIRLISPWCGWDDVGPGGPAGSSRP